MELKNKAPYQYPHILARDKLQLKIIKLIRDWDLSKNKCPDAGKTSIYVKKNVEGVLRVCIKYGLFEEARMAAAYRRKPCLTTAEVEAVLEALLERYTPYSPPGAGGARYNRLDIHSYPPFVELLQAVSDNFREKMAKRHW